jgi:hypothetical protein
LADIDVPRRDAQTAAGIYVLSPGTLIAAALAVCVAQVALAIPAVLNGLFQQDLGPASSQLTWITDALLLPVCGAGSRGAHPDRCTRTGAQDAAGPADARRGMNQMLRKDSATRR